MGQAAVLPRGTPPNALAAVISPADASPKQYLVFSLAGESFGISIRSVKEIIEFGQLTQVPMMPSLVRGVINLRGAVVPVVDLGVRFGRGETKVSRRTCIVIVEATTEDCPVQVLGIIVDAVSEVMEISAEDIEPPPAFGA
ncbi:partial Chemotaxis protein CheW, partial [Burkholderiales bacterium]